MAQNKKKLNFLKMPQPTKNDYIFVFELVNPKVVLGQFQLGKEKTSFAQKTINSIVTGILMFA